MDLHWYKNEVKDKYDFLIIAFAGYARSGKDTAASIVKDFLDKNHENIFPVITRFADPIKFAAAGLLKDFFVSTSRNVVFDSLIEILDEYKNSGEQIGGIDIRKLYQDIGSVIRKQNPDFYINTMIYRIYKTTYDLMQIDIYRAFEPDLKNQKIVFLIPDTRFPNEVELMRKEFGDKYKLIMIERPEIMEKVARNEPPYNHESEKYINELTYDYKIVNNKDIKHLEYSVLTYIKKLLKFYNII